MVDKLKQIRETMLKELKHIPERSRPQRELRMVYSRNRMHSLGKKADMPKTTKVFGMSAFLPRLCILFLE